MNDAASAAISDAEGRLLLIRQNYAGRRYSFPGGAVEPGETPEQAVVREVLEETGVDAEIVERVGVYELASGRKVFLYVCRIVRGTPSVPDGDEIAELGWYTHADVPQPRSNILHHALADLAAGRRGVYRRCLESVA